MKVVRFLVLLLMVVGSLNWGLIGFFQYDLVSDIFGGMDTSGARFIFSLVGIAGLLGIKALCHCCCGGGCGGGGCKCGPNCRCNKPGSGGSCSRD
jgi:uncharacterized membrane protein YuzA (DUF378 family)